MANILYEVVDHVAYLTLNRPERHNAMSHDLTDEFDAALDKAEADDDVRVLVLKGNGKSFCSGWDLKSSYYLHGPRGGRKPDHSLEDAWMERRAIEARYMRLWNFKRPTIAQVHGHAIAAGCYLTLLCDITIAAEDATFGHPLPGGVSSMPLWQFVLGPKIARYLLFSGEFINGRQAADMGLASIAVPPEELSPTVDRLAAKIASYNPEGLFQSKEVLNTDLEMMGLGAMFRYHGQNNPLGMAYKKR